MLKVREILSAKSINAVYAVTPSQMVIEALDLMTSHNIGAVMVLENNRLMGIFSERDYARKGILKDRKAISTPISEVMTANVFTVTPSDNLEDCMQLMTDKKIRHLPVLDDGKVIGLVSIGDVVMAINGQPVDQVDQLRQVLSTKPRSVALLVWRGGERLFVPVPLG